MRSRIRHFFILASTVLVFGAGVVLAKQLPGVWAYVLGFGSGTAWTVYRLFADDSKDKQETSAP